MIHRIRMLEWVVVGIAVSSAFGSVALAARGPRGPIVPAALPVPPPSAVPRRPVDRPAWSPSTNPPPSNPARELHLVVPQKPLDVGDPSAFAMKQAPTVAKRVVVLRTPRGIDATDPFGDPTRPPRIVYPRYGEAISERPLRPIDRTAPY